MKARAIIVLVAALFVGGTSLAFAQSNSQVVHEGSSRGQPAGCYDSYGRHVRC
jgi:hypothetical protein